MILVDISQVSPKRILIATGLVAVALAVSAFVAYGWYQNRELIESNKVLKEGTVVLGQSLKVTREQLASSSSENSNLTSQNADLAENLSTEQKKNDELQYSIQQQINQIYGTVGTLEKLSKTDAELLAKYSKVYFLNENYAPPSLSAIDVAYSSDPKKSQLINSSVSPFLQRMLQTATQDKIELKIVSAFRSFAEQSAVKSSYKITYGSGANKFSADQGYSEHQLGTTVDLTTTGVTDLSLKLETTPAYKWLNDNAYKYGFVLSYPKNNSYYIFEPWHWRFVGVALATDLHNNKQYFYEMPQRDINNYLVKIFD